MAYIIPKVFSSEMTPDQKKSLVARSGNNETINKILAVALASGDTIMNSPNGTIVDRWNEFVDSPKNIAVAAKKMYGATPDQLSSLPVAVYDVNTDEFIAGSEHIPFHDCNPNRLYTGLVSVGGQAKAVINDESFDSILESKKSMYRKFSKANQADDAQRIETEIKSMMSAEEHSTVAQREKVVETSLFNVSTVENKATKTRVPRVPFVNNKDAGSRKREGILTGVLGDDDFKETVQVIFRADFQKFNGSNDSALVNRMMTVKPSSITALASTLTGPKGAVYSSQHDTLAKEVKEAGQSNLINRAIANQIFSKVTNPDNFKQAGGVDENGKKLYAHVVNKNGEESLRNISSYLVTVQFTSEEMAELVKLFINRAVKMNIATGKGLEMAGDANNQDNQGQRTQNSSGKVSEGDAVESDRENREDAALNIAENMDTVVEERGEINKYLSEESKNALNNIIQLYNNIKRFGGTGALFNDPIFAKNAAFLASGKITDDDTEFDLGGDDSTSAETNVCNMVTGVLRALLSYNNGAGWSFFDASKVKVENRDGNWYITDWGLTPEAMIEYDAYKERGNQSLAGKRKDDSFSISKNENLRSDTAGRFDDEFIGLLLSEMYDPKHMAYGVSGPIKALVKTEMRIGELCNQMYDTPDTHGGVTLNKIIAGEDAEDVVKDSNGEAWDELLRYPRVSINNTLDEIGEQVQSLPDEVLREVARTLLYVNYPTVKGSGSKNRFLMLNSNDYLGMLHPLLGDDKYEAFRHEWADFVKRFRSQDGQNNQNSIMMGGIYLEACILGEIPNLSVSRECQIALIRYLLGDRASGAYANTMDTAAMGIDNNSATRNEQHKVIKNQICNQTKQNVLEKIVDSLYLAKTGGKQQSNMISIGYDGETESSSSALALVDDDRKSELYQALKGKITNAISAVMSQNAESGATEIDSMAAVVGKLNTIDVDTKENILKQLSAVEHLDKTDGDIVALMALPGTLLIQAERLYLNEDWTDILDGSSETGSTALTTGNNRRKSNPFAYKTDTASLGTLIDSLVSYLAHKGYTPMSEMYKDAVDTHSKDNVIKLVRSVERALGGNANFSDGEGGRNVGVIDFGFDVDKLTNFDEIEHGMGFSKRRKDNKFGQAVGKAIAANNEKEMNDTVSFDDLDALGSDDGLL